MLLASNKRKLRPLVDNITRWEGKYSLVSRALDFKAAFVAYKGGELKLNGESRELQKPEFWRRIKYYKAILGHFHILSKVSQTETALSKSPLLRWIKNARYGVESGNVSGLQEELDLRAKFVRAFDHYFRSLWTTVNNTTKSAILDPQNYPDVINWIGSDVCNAAWAQFEADAVTLFRGDLLRETVPSVMHLFCTNARHRLQSAANQLVLEFWSAQNDLSTLFPAVRATLCICKFCEGRALVFSSWLGDRQAHVWIEC